MKKLNCKHGLEKKQELEARKIRRVLIGKKEDENDAVKNRIKNLYNAFVFSNHKTIYVFYNYMQKNDVVLFSAFERIGGITKLSSYISENEIL